MKTIAAIFLLASTLTSTANTYTYVPNPSNLNDLDHHRAYAWRIDGVSIANQTILSATLSIASIKNWDATANMLFVHLLDTALGAGVTSFADATGVPVPSSQIIDDFANPRYLTNPLVNGATTANTFLDSRSFTMTAVNYTIPFTGAQIAALTTYINNGNNIAFGFDPDCHFFNNGITFSFNTQPKTTTQVPETGKTLALFGIGLIALGVAQRKLAA